MRKIFGVIGLCLGGALCALAPLSSEAAESLLQVQGCTECHRVASGVPEEGRKGPDLFFAGNKFKREWLEAWLEKPAPIRPAGWAQAPEFLKGIPGPGFSHPKTEAGKVGEVADALMQRVLPDWQGGRVPTEPLSKGSRFKIKQKFERQFGCIACHQSVNLAGQPRGGVSGPSFLDAGDRLQADWVYQWLGNPERFEPRGRMPRFKLEEQDRVDLTRYIMWHNQKNLK